LVSVPVSRKFADVAITLSRRGVPELWGYYYRFGAGKLWDDSLILAQF
jgi:hypothetical protein